jgi:geranylgeranyl diphosphate synthase type II
MTVVSLLIQQIQDIMTHFDFEIPPSSHTTTWQNEIQQAHVYPLAAGGKRIRPLLTLLMACAVGGEAALKTASPSAVALEMLHTYTLVHDDLPCMDDDDLRRGRPTTHKVYGEAKALLVGDGLLAQSFGMLAQTPWPGEVCYLKELLESLTAAASPKGVIWGQWLDLSLTGEEATTWEQMEIVHKYKTGALLAACLEMGLLCGLSHTHFEQPLLKELREKAKEAGFLIGLAFQIWDDILDGTKTTAELGKTAGKDESQNKLTALRLLGEKKSKEFCAAHTLRAKNLLDQIFERLPQSHDQGKNALSSLLESLLSREH